MILFSIFFPLVVPVSLLIALLVTNKMAMGVRLAVVSLGAAVINLLLTMVIIIAAGMADPTAPPFMEMVKSIFSGLTVQTALYTSAVPFVAGILFTALNVRRPVKASTTYTPASSMSQGVMTPDTPEANA
jgi:hypothetical protein